MFDLRVILTVAVGAAIGGVLRLLVTQAVVARAGLAYGPAATAFINISGSFLIGVVVESAALRAGVSPLWRSFLATGILGGYTTFSTFSLETLTLAGTVSLPLAVLYAGGSVVLGIAGAFAGIATARAFPPAG